MTRANLARLIVNVPKTFPVSFQVGLVRDPPDLQARAITVGRQVHFVVADGQAPIDLFV